MFFLSVQKLKNQPSNKRLLTLFLFKLLRKEIFSSILNEGCRPLFIFLVFLEKRGNKAQRIFSLNPYI